MHIKNELRRLHQSMSLGWACGHAGEILQGALEHEGGIRRFLVSLPAPALRSQAAFSHRPAGGLQISPIWKRKSLCAAELTFLQLGHANPNGILHLSDEIPTGRGLGSSTSDCVAAIRAVASYCGVICTAEFVARMTQQAELASDGTMFENTLTAFLHCEGRLLEKFHAPVPRLRLLIVEPREQTEPVRTEALRRPAYSSAQLDYFARLLERLRTALLTDNMAELGAVASASAEINQAYLAKAHFDMLVSVANETRALGMAAAHSGTILTLIYSEASNADEQLIEARARLAARGLHSVRELCTWADAGE